MELSEKAITYLENQIPLLAEFAGRQAFLNALAAGRPVLVARDGKLIRIFPDGSELFVKDIDPPVKVSILQFHRKREGNS